MLSVGRTAGSALLTDPGARLGGRPARVSAGSRAGLDWLNFFVANLQTGFGPFIAVYLTAQAWTQIDIGLVLTLSGLIALAGQMPGGALVDAARSKKLAAAWSAAAIGLSGLALAASPVFAVVLAAEIVHALASCVLGPAIAAITLGLVDDGHVGVRFGRNVRFASVGNGVAAAFMGACGRLISNQAVFVATALLAVPTLLALHRIRSEEIDEARARGGKPQAGHAGWLAVGHDFIGNRPLVIFTLSVLAFHLANAAMLPLLGGVVTKRSTDWATVLIATCIVVPQVVVALFSPWVGRKAETWGRRPLLLIGFAALPIRSLLFALVSTPYLLVIIQMLDGISAAIFGVMLPLVIADATRGTGRFNLSQGIVGSAAGVGASLSTLLAGYLSDSFGGAAAFIGLGGLGGLGLATVWLLMPETRPDGRAEAT
jgi:MFS family permease